MTNSWPSLSEARDSHLEEPTPPVAFVHAIRSHVLLVLLVAAATVAGSVAAYELRDPQFRAEAELIVTPLPVDDLSFLRIPLLRESGDTTRTIQTAAALVDSPQAAARTAQQLGARWSQSRVAGAVDVEPKGQTNILAVTATASTGEEAARVANAFAEAIVSTRGEVTSARAGEAIPLVRGRLRTLQPANPAAVDLERLVSRLETLEASGDPTVSVAELATAPSASVGQPLALIVALALLAGFILGIAAALLRELINPDAIHGETDLLRVLSLPVLGRLPKSPLRVTSGPDGPQLPASVRSTCRDVRTQLELVPNQHRTVLFTATTSKEGASDAAGSFALTLALDGDRVRFATAAQNGSVHEALRLSSPGRSGSLVPPLGAGGASEARESGATRVDGVPLLDVCELPDTLRHNRRSPEESDRSDLENAHSVDFYVIDAPPLGEVTDALKYVREADDVVIVVRLSRTTRPQLERVRGLLARAGVTPAGCIIVEG